MALTRLTVVYIIKPHRMHAVQKMWPIATDVARSVVCVSVCLCELVLCKNGWTDRNAAWVADSGVPKEPCIIGSRSPARKSSFGGCPAHRKVLGVSAAATSITARQARQNSLVGLLVIYRRLFAECTAFRLPLLLQNGNRYKVIVRGLKLQRQNMSTTAECFSVLCRGSAEIRAGDGKFVIVIPNTN